MLLNEGLFETTNTLEDQLKAIDYVKKVEFDDDGLGQTIILTHFDDSIYDIQGSNYFKVRDKIKKQILQTIRNNGYVMVDPVEDNDTYLYLVYRKKDMQESLNINVEGKLNNFLNENDLYPELWREGNNIYVSIHWGDWKHDHLRLHYLVNEFNKANDINIEHINTQITEEDGSDTYSAIHVFEITDIVKEDLTDTINQQIDDRNANYEADRQATRDMRQELDKQGIATDTDGKPFTEDVKKMTLQEFANKIRYNGASHRGAEIPGEIDIYVNQCNIPDNMRIKWLDAEVISDDTIQIDYLTQEEFNSDDADVFVQEVKRAINSMIEYYEFNMPFNISLTVTSRDGEEYGHALIDLQFNQSGDVKADNLRKRIEETIANIEIMDEEASSYEEQADRCLEKGNEEGYQYYKEHADDLRRSIDRAAAYLSSLEEQEEPMNESLLVEDTKFINKEEPDAFITLNDDGTVKETSHGNKIGKKLIEINDTVYFIKQIDENTVHAYSLDEEGQIQKEHPFVFKSEVSKTIDQEDTNNQDGKAEELKAKAEELLTRIKESRDENIWFEVLVPQSGPADSKAGELIRAIERLRYRDYNDGDRFFIGYGLETCASAAAYLMDNGYEYEIEQIMEQELDGQFYTGALDDLFNRITFHIKGNPSLLTEPNEDDMLEWDTSAIKDLTPKYDDSYTIPSEVIDAVESGAFGEESLRWDLESWFESYDDIEVEVDVNNGILYLSNMRKEEYDEISRHIDDWFMQYVDDNAEYFSTDDDEYDEEEDEE